MKRVRALLIFLVIGMFVFSLAPVLAEDEVSAGDANSTIDEDTGVNSIDTTFIEDAGENIQEDVANLEILEKEYAEEEITNPGLTPDSAFYFIDDIMSNFKGNIQNREEKVAEIKAMVKEGNYDAAKIALEKYQGYADEIEREADPEKREEARKSVAVVYRAVKEMGDEIDENEKETFVDNVLEQENKIITAVEISDKIKLLCEQLAGLDPLQYSKICNVGGDSSKWKKNMNKQLTKEQETEAKQFGQIMSECFKTSGRECKCEDISFYDFSVACSKVAPLAAKCDAGSEDACRMMDEIEMPELPDYLEDIFEDVEEQYGEGKYDMYMPPECIEAGVTNPKECGKIMVKEHAPPECRQALLDANVQSEKEGREIRDKIMFEKHSPPECIEKGITSPEECGRFMDSFRGPGGSPMGMGPGGFGPPGQECMKLDDPNERLECFEGAVGDMGNHYGVGEKFEEGRGEITWQCKENRIHWPPDCEKFMREEWPEQERMRGEERNREWEEKDDWRVKEKECANSCRDGRWDFREGHCTCYPDDYERREDYGPPEGYEGGEYYGPGGEYIPEEGYEGPTDDYQGTYPPENYVPPEDGTPYTSDDQAIPGPADEGPSEPESTPEPASESAPITGEVIARNRFLDYYSRR